MAADQLQEIANQIQDFDFAEEQDDVWSYCWGPSKYSSKKAYKSMLVHSEASPLFSWLWASDNLGKHKFFLLLLRDRLNTRNLLRRKNMHLDEYNCVLCSTGEEETCFHLFFQCPFSQTCWSTIPINWNLSMQPLDMVIQAREDFGSIIFREIFITACWIIWITRNGVIFDNEQANINTWKRRSREELGLVHKSQANQAAPT